MTAQKDAGTTGAGRGADPIARLFLTAALLLGLLRFVRLGTWSLWLDEVLTLADSLHGEVFKLKNPLGYLLHGGWFGLLEGRPNELELRLPSALFGWLSIAATYWAFAPLAGRRVASFAALLLSVSTWHVYWSQTARFYTLAQLISLVGAGLVLRGIWAGSTVRLVSGLAALGTAALAHLSASFLVAPLVAVPFLLKRDGARLAGPKGWVGRVLIVTVLMGAALGARTLYDAWYVWTVVKGIGTPLHLILTTGFYVTPLLGAGAGLGALSAIRGRRPFELLCLATVVAVLLEATVASVSGRVTAQYVFVLLPWITLLAALPLRERGTTFLWSYAAILALPALTVVGLYFTARGGERPDWRAAYRHVYENRRPDDLVLGMDAPVGEYYFTPSETDLRDQLHVTYLDSWRARVPEQWARFGRRTWFVVNHEQLLDWKDRDRDAMRRILAEDCRLVTMFPLVVESRDLSVFVYLRE